MRRIATVPFTLRNLKEDLEDVGSRFDGSPDLEFRMATEALELEKSGLSYQRVPPGYRFPYGHTHKKQEEVYVVRSEEHTSELQSRQYLVCRLLLEKKKVCSNPFDSRIYQRVY